MTAAWWTPPAWLRSRTAGRTAAGVVVLGTGVWYGWLARPHNALLSNSRIHWVDYLTWNSDNYGYAAGRLPHLVFYEAPFVWQGINAGIVAALCFAIGRQLGFSTWLSAAMATLPAISGNLLLFATAGEDVMLNTMLLLFVIFAALRREPIMMGVALTVAVLGRPSFIILFPCLVLAELACRLRARSDAHRADWHYVSSAVGVGLVLTISMQLLFSVLGRRHFLTNGQFIRTSGLDSLVPRRVEGFLISPFSGAYVTHFLWTLPLVFLVGAAVSVVTTPRQRQPVAATIYFSGLFVVVHLLVHEAKPLAYYNTRYLAFTLPSLFFMAWASIARPGFPAKGSYRAAVVSLLVLGPFTLPADPIEAKRAVEARPEVQLLSARHELRALVGDRPVFLNFGDALSRNYLAYVLRRDASTIRLLDPDLSARGLAGIEQEELEYRPGDIVISLRADPWNDEPIDLTVGDFIVTDGRD